MFIVIDAETAHAETTYRCSGGEIHVDDDAARIGSPEVYRTTKNHLSAAFTCSRLVFDVAQPIAATPR